jgi:polyhydroxyalkanoate synthesis repressor PhaR
MSASVNESVVIKKYANRRLYNTSTSTYVTLEDLGTMVKSGTEFNVYDAKNNEDITRSVLAQIISEEEGKPGQNLLPIGFMRRLIGFYGNNMQWLVPKYLEHSLQSLTKNQTQISEYFQTTFGSMFPFGNTLEQMSKQNLAMFENTMRMFSPFGATGISAEAEKIECCGAAKAQSSGSAALATASEACCKSKDKAPEKTVEKVAETVSVSAAPAPKKKLTAVPTPETTKATAQNAVSGEDVQNKIAALQRQLSELARSKG